MAHQAKTDKPAAAPFQPQPESTGRKFCAPLIDYTNLFTRGQPDMKNTRTLIINLFAASSLLFVVSGARADEPLALQQVMKDLGKNMQVITDGISRGDWDQVGKTAP